MQNANPTQIIRMQKDMIFSFLYISLLKLHIYMILIWHMRLSEAYRVRAMD